MIPSKLISSGLLGQTAQGRKCPICYKAEAQRDATAVGKTMTEQAYREKYDLCFLHFMAVQIQREHRKHSKEGTSCQDP